MSLSRILLLGIVALSTGWLAPFQVLAHGGGELIVNSGRAGPYAVSVWLNPPQSRAEDSLHYTVALASPADGAPILGAIISVQMDPLSGDFAPISGHATSEGSTNRLLYEADLVVPQPGTYETTFFIDGPDGAASLTLELEVLPASGVNWLWGAAAGLVLVAGVALFVRGRRQAGNGAEEPMSNAGSEVDC